MPQQYLVTSRSQERTIAMLRRKLRNAESCLNKIKLNVVEILHFVEDTDVNDQGDVLLSNNFVICKSNEILNTTPDDEMQPDESRAQTGIANDSEDGSEYDSEDNSEYDSGDDTECETEDDTDDMPALEDDMPDDDMPDEGYDSMPSLESDSDDSMPALEGDPNDGNNVFNYDYTYLNNQTHKFENIYIDGIHHYHDKYGDVTGFANLLLVFDSNQDLEAVGFYNPDLEIENTLPIQD